MKTLRQRMEDFVEYHINGDGECNTVVLKAWAEIHNIGFQERYELAFWFAVTYCVESALILRREQQKYDCLTTAQLTDIKRRICFQSDRKYMRMKDRFERCVEYFYNNNRDGEGFIKSVSVDGVVDLEKAIKTVSGWKLFGRFSAYLFLEMLMELLKLPVKNTTIEWKNGDTATSGLMNLFGYDSLAYIFDKTGKLLLPESVMDKMLAFTLAEIEKAGGITNITQVETSLCAYRKFFKGSRYNGYYLDRMLEEILKMKTQFPEVSAELFEIRAACFNKKYLGEIGGWNGVRSQMKKAYKISGVVT